MEYNRLDDMETRRSVGVTQALQDAVDDCKRNMETIQYGLENIAISSDWRVTDAADIAVRVMQSVNHIVATLCQHIVARVPCDMNHPAKPGANNVAVKASLIDINDHLRAIQDSINRIIDGEADNYSDTLKLE